MYTVILEAKWRPLRNIYSEKDDTDIVETLKDYYNLGYHDEKMHRTIRSVVSKVVVLYPDVGTKVTNIQNDEILAFGFLPVGPQSANEIINALQDLVLTN